MAEIFLDGSISYFMEDTGKMDEQTKVWHIPEEQKNTTSEQEMEEINGNVRVPNNDRPE